MIITRINWQRILFCITIAVIYILSARIQFSTFMNVDSANALDEARVLLHGGRFFHDIFETTPPLFLYLNFPLIYLIDKFKNVNFFFFIYYMAIYSILLIIANFFLKQIFTDEEFSRRYFFIVVAVLFLFVISETLFAQREYTCFIFTLPYFLLFSLRLDDKVVNPWLVFLTSIFAAIGFSLKPHFCFPFIISEIYYFFHQKSFKKIIRIENTVIYFFVSFYALSTYLIYPEYFTHIIPLTYQFYYLGLRDAFINYKNISIFVYYGALILVFACIVRSDKNYSSVVKAFSIAIVGFIFTYFSGLVFWGYHIFQAIGFSILLAVFLILKLFKFLEEKKFTVFIMLLLGFSFFILNVKDFSVVRVNVIQTVILMVSVIIFVFFLVTSLFLKYYHTKTVRMAAVVFFAISISIHPVILAFSMIVGQQKYSLAVLPIQRFLFEYVAHKKVYFLTSSLPMEYSSINYTDAIHVSRFPYLIWMPGYFYAMRNSNLSDAEKMNKLSLYFIDLLGKDLESKKPDYILVESGKHISTPGFLVNDADYIKIFSQVSVFKNAFKNYRFFAKIQNGKTYTFTVYQRKNPRNSKSY